MKKKISIIQTKSATLLGKEYSVIKGTIRDKHDYDDAWLLVLAQDAKIIFDIGCNIGQSTLLMIHPQKVEKIILVDPNRMALSQAAQNLIMNHLSHKAVFISAFVSDVKDMQVEFYTVGAGAAGSMYEDHAKTATKLNEHSVVPTTTIDQIVNEFECNS